MYSVFSGGLVGVSSFGVGGTNAHVVLGHGAERPLGALVHRPVHLVDHTTAGSSSGRVNKISFRQSYLEIIPCCQDISLEQFIDYFFKSQHSFR